MPSDGFRTVQGPDGLLNIEYHGVLPPHVQPTPSLSGLRWTDPRKTTIDQIFGLVNELLDTPESKGGLSASYYNLPEGAKELTDLIEYKNMPFHVGNIFKACYRLGDKAGNSRKYDLAKIIFSALREIRRIDQYEQKGSETK